MIDRGDAAAEETAEDEVISDLERALGVRVRDRALLISALKRLAELPDDSETEGAEEGPKSLEDLFG